jgi:hypothetical protein
MPKIAALVSPAAMELPKVVVGMEEAKEGEKVQEIPPIRSMRHDKAHRLSSRDDTVDNTSTAPEDGLSGPYEGGSTYPTYC